MPGPAPGPPGWLQRQQQIAEEKERVRELTASMTPAHKDAFKLLTSKSIAVTTIVRVDPDAILFLDQKAGFPRARTAWLRSYQTGGSPKVCVEDGFPSEPGKTVRAAFGEIH